MQLTGPVTGGSHGWAFAGPVADLAAHGYRQDEFFLEGVATRYGPSSGSELAWDGRWEVEPRGSAPYKTRIVVVRPEDPARFNGTVVVLWNNVSAGYENFGGGDSPELYEGGYACVAVTTQRVGVHGAPVDPQGLLAWDPERYGSLSIPSDDYSFDIFTQAASVVGPDRADHGVDPMGGLEVRRLIAEGASQSAARLATYLNAIQPETGSFDAFLLTMYFGGGAPLEVGDAVMTVQAAGGGGPRIPEGLHLLRDDLGRPVMVVNTECEAKACYRVRQPDTDHYRYWEVAGASHVSLQGLVSSAPRTERDFGFSIPIDDATKSVNQVSVAPVVDAALHHVNVWAQGGAAPPVQPRIEFSGDPPEIVRDGNGIARGGIRLPVVEVPIAHNSALQQSPDVFSRLVGYHEPFPPEKVRALYGTRAAYVERYEEAARAAVAASVILPRDVDAVVREGTAGVPL
ncbi:MAG: alpha/beta hydrolase domain-containing protein [Acidimicrobiales bacterium]